MVSRKQRVLVVHVAMLLQWVKIISAFVLENVGLSFLATRRSWFVLTLSLVRVCQCYWCRDYAGYFMCMREGASRIGCHVNMLVTYLFCLFVCLFVF